MNKQRKDDLYKLYKERAEWADLESEISEARKYAQEGGLFWRIHNALDHFCKNGRSEIQEEIDYITKKDGGPDR